MRAGSGRRLATNVFQSSALVLAESPGARRHWTRSASLSVGRSQVPTATLRIPIGDQPRGSPGRLPVATVTPKYEEDGTTLAAPIGESAAAAFQRSGWSAGTTKDLREQEQASADWSQV